MKIVSWNVNGLRAVYKKGFLEWFKSAKADIVCLQEIKAKKNQVPEKLRQFPGYFCYFNPAEKPGYSGTAVFSREKPLKVEQGLGLKRFDREGRVLKLFYPNFVLFNFYIPFGGRDKENLSYKLAVYKHLLQSLRATPPKAGERGNPAAKLLLVGDFNVAHREIDLARPKENKNNIMFTLKEREQIDRLLELGFVDTFRRFYPNKTGAYTWWSNFSNARARNLGWRIDYCFASRALAKKVKQAFIWPEVHGSDHCPIGLDIF